MIELRDYQKEAVEAIQNNHKGIVEAATGSGKTTIMSQAIKQQYDDNKILILVHLKTLVEQTRKRMENETDLRVASFYGDQRDYFSENDVIVSTWQSMQQVIKSKFISPAYFEHIHIDECHNVRNPAYRKVINFFNPDTLHGYTATFEGSGKDKIIDIFDEVIYDIGLFDLIRQGYLSKMKVMIHVNEMDNIKHNQEYNEKKFETINEMTRKNGTPTKALHFYSRNKRFYEIHNWNLLKTGSYAKVSGNTKREKRQEIFNTFQDENSGLNHILSNRVLNEGVDLPIANTVVFHETIGDFRIVTQRIGRGLRVHEGSDAITQVLFFLESNQRRDINNILYFIDEIDREKEKHGLKKTHSHNKKAKKHNNEPTDEMPITITMIDKTEDFLERYKSFKHSKHSKHDMNKYEVKCAECGKKLLVRRHLYDDIQSGSSIKCDDCKIKRDSNKYINHYCQVCGKGIHITPSMIKKAENGAKIKCDDCKNHYQKHYSNNHKCPVCGKRMVVFETILKKIQSGKLNPKCDDCKKKYGRKRTRDILRELGKV